MKDLFIIQGCTMDEDGALVPWMAATQGDDGERGFSQINMLLLEIMISLFLMLVYLNSKTKDF